MELSSHLPHHINKAKNKQEIIPTDQALDDFADSRRREKRTLDIANLMTLRADRGGKRRREGEEREKKQYSKKAREKKSSRQLNNYLFDARI
jgi:hypothetical protein